VHAALAVFAVLLVAILAPPSNRHSPVPASPPYHCLAGVLPALPLPPLMPLADVLRLFQRTPDHNETSAHIGACSTVMHVAAVIIVAVGTSPPAPSRIVVRDYGLPTATTIAVHCLSTIVNGNVPAFARMGMARRRKTNVPRERLPESRNTSVAGVVSTSLRQLCRTAAAPCRGSGRRGITERHIEVVIVIVVFALRASRPAALPPAATAVGAVPLAVAREGKSVILVVLLLGGVVVDRVGAFVSVTPAPTTATMAVSKPAAIGASLGLSERRAIVVATSVAATAVPKTMAMLIALATTGTSAREHPRRQGRPPPFPAGDLCCCLLCGPPARVTASTRVIAVVIRTWSLEEPAHKVARSRHRAAQWRGAAPIGFSQGALAHDGLGSRGRRRHARGGKQR